MSLSKAIGVISCINEFGNLFQLVRSAVSYMRSQLSGSEEKQLKEDDVLQEKNLEENDVLQLQSDLRCLRDTLPAMYNLIDRAEWKSHVLGVEQLLPNLKDAVYDAEDLLDEFRWHELKVEIEGNATQPSPFMDFFYIITQGSFNKAADIYKRLSNLSSQLEKMGLHEGTPQFDKSLRPVTTSFCTEPKIFGREKELEEVIRLLGVPSYGSMSSLKRKRSSNATNNDQRVAFVPILPIVGIGGIGKTTLAQEITTLQRVKSYFDKIIWICISDEFDEERCTKVLIKSLSGTEATSDNLDDLQQILASEVGKKRFLLILDDIWPNALNDDGCCWRKFCAPLTNVLQGSMMVVTTRFAEVANIVGTMDSFALEGLQNDVFWQFFKLCVFGSEDYHIDPQLEQIGRSIIPKLKGAPLAAKTIGRLLRKSLDPAHWNDILNSELWQLRQQESDILPALRLSYMYLPFNLKRCFSFCATYHKDYNFDKSSLAEIWVAEGFVEPQGSIPLQHIGGQYFDDLVNLSFFQNLRGKYVIHDLMHDMAQLVSKEDCFVIKNASDMEMVPQNVRHLSILGSCNVNLSKLLSLCKHKKLRTLLCNKSLGSDTLYPVMDRWFSGLQYLRVFFCASMKGLPESIGNLKHLRYLEISRGCHFDTFPSSFCSLYNFQILYARKCKFRSLPRGFSKLINLQKFESKFSRIEVEATVLKEELSFIENFNERPNDLTIFNLGAISKDGAAEAKLKKKEYLNSLTLRWSCLRCPEHNEPEVLQALQPPTSIKSVRIVGYPGEYLPSWFCGCDLPEAMSFSKLPAATVHNNNNGGARTIFSLLTEVSITGCQNLSSLEQFLHPTTFVPAIRKIVIADCASVKSIPIEWSPSLEEIRVSNCPKMTHLSAPCVKKLKLYETFGFNIDCSSLTFLHINSSQLPSIELEKWRLPVLQRLHIGCECLKFIREFEHISTGLSLGLARARSSTAKFPLLTHLIIEYCRKLENID
ncbi:putative disease resistance protein RGA3, partial [Panicum virgatum]